jgi:hypothetical protein
MLLALLGGSRHTLDNTVRVPAVMRRFGVFPVHTSSSESNRGDDVSQALYLTRRTVSAVPVHAVALFLDGLDGCTERITLSQQGGNVRAESPDR